MKTILTLTNFSEESVTASLYAADMAAAFNCKLVILNVCLVPAGFSDVPVTQDTIDGWMQDAEQEMKLLAGQVRFHVQDRIGVDTSVQQGSVMHEIKEYCAKLDPIAIVVGAESVGEFESFFSEGQTIRAINELAWPVLVIPAGSKYHTVKKIGLTCDLRNGIATKAVIQIQHLLQMLKAELHIVHVSDVGHSSPGEIAEGETVKTMFATMLPELHFIYRKGQENAILNFAAQNDIDLLMILPKHHPFPGSLFHKSFSRALVLKANVPVFSLHQ